MSHNIIIKGYGFFPYQTPTYVTNSVLTNCRGKTFLEQDLHCIEQLRQWCHLSYDPKPLQGKNARNPYLIKERNREIQEIDDMVNRIKEFIIKQNGKQRLVCSN